MSPPYNPDKLGIAWRLQYGLGLIPIAYMLIHRLFFLKESAVWKVLYMLWLLFDSRPSLRFHLEVCVFLRGGQVSQSVAQLMATEIILFETTR